MGRPTCLLNGPRKAGTSALHALGEAILPAVTPGRVQGKSYYLRGRQAKPVRARKHAERLSPVVGHCDDLRTLRLFDRVVTILRDPAVIAASYFRAQNLRSPNNVYGGPPEDIDTLSRWMATDRYREFLMLTAPYFGRRLTAGTLVVWYEEILDPGIQRRVMDYLDVDGDPPGRGIYGVGTYSNSWTGSPVVISQWCAKEIADSIRQDVYRAAWREDDGQ